MKRISMKKAVLVGVTLLVFGVLQAAGSTVSKAQAQDSTPLLYWGKSGYQVQKVQQRLRDWGYYRGPVDGIYGGNTLAAVIKFQRYNGLSRDGLVGRNTWQALGYNVPTRTQEAVPVISQGGFSNDGRVNLLARVIEGEAADEPFTGKVAVGSVILNRLESSKFPDTLSSIVYQPLAFESVSNGQYNRPLSEESIKAARMALNGWDPTGGALFFWNPAKRVSPWIWSRPIVAQIGGHVFAH